MRLSTSTILVVAFAAIALFVAYDSTYTVWQTQQAIVLRLGRPRGIVTRPGLHFKDPLIESVVLLDKRLLGVETSQQEILTQDSQRLLVDAFLRYKITDPLRFYQTVRTTAGASNQLGSVLDSTLREVLGAANLVDVVTLERDALMAKILKIVNSEASRIGVTVVDARIRRADFPKEISAGVYLRMQSERQREAAQYRAEGAEAAQKIRANADREATIITADAQQKADTIRGKGDAERNLIFAKSFGQDPDFFAFYRSMRAYRTSLKGSNTRLVLSPDSSFFRYFGHPSGVLEGSPATPGTGVVSGAPPGGAALSAARAGAQPPQGRTAH